MKLHIQAVVSCAFLVSFVQSVAAQVKVVPEVVWQPKSASVPANVRVELVDSANHPLTTVNGNFVVQWDPVTNEALVLALVAKLSDSIPGPYSVGSLELQFPYYLTARTINLVIAPSIPDPSAKKARELWGRGVADMSLPTLLAFYQEARGAASARIQQMQGEWRKLDDYSVQAVYKYLQSSLWLSKETPSVLVRDTREVAAREWLGDALKNKPARVQHALGDSSIAKVLLARLAHRDGNVLIPVWKAIVGEPDDARRCKLLEFFKRDIASVEVPGLRVAHVLSAQAQCYVAQYNQSGQNSVGLRDVLLHLVQEMQAALRTGDVPEELVDNLKSDITYITNLLG